MGTVKYYLTAYNVLSSFAWSTVLILTLVHLSGGSPSYPQPVQTATSTFTKFLSTIPFFKQPPPPTPEAHVPSFLFPLLNRARSAYTVVGVLTAWTQSAAILEILHVLLGWVKSPLQTTLIQVASRLILVWGITEQFESARSSPLYASMVLSWSITEIIRYSYYTASLMSYESYPLTWLRYTTFYLLYPTGASSEAFLIYATLPAPLHGAVNFTWIGKNWGPFEYLRASLFIIWWPGLYLMYTHMIRQRSKIFGGRKLGQKDRSQTKAETKAKKKQ